jgi:hypothetical protein
MLHIPALLRIIQFAATRSHAWAMWARDQHPTCAASAPEVVDLFANVNTSEDLLSVMFELEHRSSAWDIAGSEPGISIHDAFEVHLTDPPNNKGHLYRYKHTSVTGRLFVEVNEYQIFNLSIWRPGIVRNHVVLATQGHMDPRVTVSPMYWGAIEAFGDFEERHMEALLSTRKDLSVKNIDALPDPKEVGINLDTYGPGRVRPTTE